MSLSFVILCTFPPKHFLGIETDESGDNFIGCCLSRNQFIVFVGNGMGGGGGSKLVQCSLPLFFFFLFNAQQNLFFWGGGWMLEYSRQNVSFSEAAEQMKVSEDDRLGSFTKELGKVLMSMDVSCCCPPVLCSMLHICVCVRKCMEAHKKRTTCKVASPFFFFKKKKKMSEQEYLNQLLNQLVIPLERFRDEDIEQVSALKWKYTNAKTEYDYAVNNVIKANKPDTTPEKLQDLKQKRDAKESELNNLRSEFIVSYALFSLCHCDSSLVYQTQQQQLERFGFGCLFSTNLKKKNNELLANAQRFYGSLLTYAKHISGIVHDNPIVPKSTNGLEHNSYLTFQDENDRKDIDFSSRNIYTPVDTIHDSSANHTHVYLEGVPISDTETADSNGRKNMINQ
ncbi:hypothetical protein RFI_11239 [Reticulomyxa filosa]|uniref:BAR domain-containing protein n=1 Tax=Reticulomyxa filosa TaxID=46433 RepID=X6NKM7_RETFI|nr:hypothetical protein RFI_11239 [Reticulomyxa filosa]|eukprot:ETO25897.1 hypothetical protein RFI_11239 [Reticulomyxa filosa]